MRDATRTRPVRIYGIRHTDGTIRYVGQTTRTLAHRLQVHQKEARAGSSFPIHEWLRSVGSNVIICELEVCQFDDRHERESHWIAQLGTLASQGGLNQSLGSVPSDVMRERMRNSWADDRRERMGTSTRARNQHRWQDDEYRAKTSAVGRANMDRGRHTRWHVMRGIVKPDCRLCATAAERDATGNPAGTPARS